MVVLKLTDAANRVAIINLHAISHITEVNAGREKHHICFHFIGGKCLSVYAKDCPPIDELKQKLLTI